MTDHQREPVLQSLIEAATADPDTIGLILGGSRGAGVPDAESDYDLDWVLTDAAYERRYKAGRLDRLPWAAAAMAEHVEVAAICPRRLAELAATPGWWTAGYASARVLLDTTGQVESILTLMRVLPEPLAQETVAASFDAYLNALYRSLKAWRRGDELGGRLQAAVSATALARTLFALERQPAPYHDRLVHRLDDLAAGQGWLPGYLAATLLALLRTGAPEAQRELAQRVLTLLRTRGYGQVIDAWEGKIEHVIAGDSAGR